MPAMREFDVVINKTCRNFLPDIDRDNTTGISGWNASMIITLPVMVVATAQCFYEEYCRRAE
jgi:hypothetical protein